MSKVLAGSAEENEALTLEEAKKMIKDFFKSHHGQLIDYVDIVEAVGLPLPVIVAACNKLEEEGQIASVD